MAQDSVDSYAGTGRAAGAAEPLDELDLALVHALQVAPRAPWSGLAPVLGVDAVTLARRWRRLSASGRAWVTCYPGPGRGAGGPGCLALVELAVERGALAAVRDTLSGDAQAVSVEHVSDGRDLLLTVGAPDAPALSAYVQHRLSHVPGVVSVRPHLVTRLYQEGAAWRLRALDAGQQRTLGTASDEAPRDRRVTAVDRALVLALGRDGRTPVNALARTVGVSPATAARRVAWLIGSGHARLRCEVAHTLSGWPVTALWWVRVPPPDLDEVGRRLAAHPDVRMSAAVTGPANLYTAMWLRSLADLPAFEADLIRRYPRVEVLDRTVVLDSAKRIGRILAADGRCVGYVPMKLWEGEDGPRSAP